MNRRIFFSLIFVFLIIALASFSGVLSSFIIGLIIAYIFDPFIDFFEEKKIRRELGIALVFSVFVLAIFLFTLFTYPIISNELKTFGKKIPQYMDYLQKTTLPFVKDYIDKHPEHLKVLQERVQSFGMELLVPFVNFFKGLFSGFSRLITGILDLLIIPIMAFYLLKDIDKLKLKILEAVPARYEDRLVDVVSEIDVTLRDFLKGQFTVSIILAIIYSIGLSIFGVPVAIVIGLVAGFANMIPYLGIAIGLVPALLLSYLDSGNLFNAGGIILTFVIAQILEGSVISPKVVGDKVGLHPVTVIIAIILGGHYFGFTGIIAAVPVASILNVLVRRSYKWYLQSDYYLN